MGTPDFARTCLDGLVCAGEQIVGAVTQPDRPKGRGYLLTPSPVKEYALAHGIPVYTPDTLRDEAFAELLCTLDPELIAVAAYGKILPINVLDYPKYGCINVHTSLLPRYRGAAPMQRAIMDGCEKTGVTIMYMAQGLDTGDILQTEQVPIGANDTLEDLHDRLAEVGARLLPQTAAAIAKGELTPIPQDDTLATYADKITREDQELSFGESAQRLHDRIRALSPAPLTRTILHGKLLKVVRSEVVQPDGVHGAPGEVIALTDTGIHVACGAGVLALTAVLPEGKGRMSAADFIRGRKIAAGDRLGE